MVWTVEKLQALLPGTNTGGVRLGVLGDPVEHSLSPVMQNAALAARGLPYRYDRLLVSPPQLETAFACLRNLEFIGWNLTIPHKIAGYRLVNHLDREAEALGAINTVVNRGGNLIGFNTDGRGLQAALVDAFAVDPGKSKIALLGAGGGAGQASARFLANLRPERLLLVNRTAEKMDMLRRELAANSNVTFWDFDQLREVFLEADLVINASSLGLTGAALDWDPRWLRVQHRLFDMVYRPQGDTPLVTWGRQNGVPAVDGRLMLLHQGAFAFEHWFGQPVPLAAMREALIGGPG
ncbi:MAG TPA: shikimate dehydrogenase [Chthoniobacterales bacterium]|nr:shikimate dehydrogenase [Chthoniobacterales bacterium]